MIAIDTSSFIAYLTGANGPDVDATGVALEHKQAALPPVVLSELLSDPKLSRSITALFGQLPLLEVMDGYWELAGLLLAAISRAGRRAPLADSLIAQSCMDHQVALITRDADFRYFVRSAGLRLVPNG